MRFTLTYTTAARDDLAELWLDATDRPSVTQSSNTIECELSDDPHTKGEAVAERLRKFVAPPLVYYYVVSPDDCLTTVWAVRRVKS